MPQITVAQTCFNNNPPPSFPPISPLILRQMWTLSWKGGNLSANWSSFTGEVFLARIVYSCWLPTPTSCSYNWDDQPVSCLECLPSLQEETSPNASRWLNWGNCLIHWSNQCSEWKSPGSSFFSFRFIKVFNNAGIFQLKDGEVIHDFIDESRD